MLVEWPSLWTVHDEMSVVLQTLPSTQPRLAGTLGRIVMATSRLVGLMAYFVSPINRAKTPTLQWFVMQWSDILQGMSVGHRMFYVEPPSLQEYLGFQWDDNLNALFDHDLLTSLQQNAS
jgi:hypothetical protein